MSRIRLGVYAVLAAYWAALSVLLLVPNPWRVVGFLSSAEEFVPDRGVHTTLFFGLTLLVYLARWPRAADWRVPSLLVAYAFTAETLQAFVPPRTVDFWDYFENFVGIGLGAAAYMLVWRRVAARPRLYREPEAETA